MSMLLTAAIFTLGFVAGIAFTIWMLYLRAE